MYAESLKMAYRHCRQVFCIHRSPARLDLSAKNMATESLEFAPYLYLGAVLCCYFTPLLRKQDTLIFTSQRSLSPEIC